MTPQKVERQVLVLTDEEAIREFEYYKANVIMASLKGR